MKYFKKTKKQIQKIRNDIFVQKAIPALQKNGFQFSPFSTAWNKKNNLGDYDYELCRVNNNSQLETLQIYIVKEDRYIQTYLNIFELMPEIKSLEKLQGLDGIKFGVPPNSLKEMEIPSEVFSSIKSIFREYKIGCFLMKWGFNRKVKRLEKLIEKDMTNIDYFVQKWHEKHTPNITDWEGNIIKEMP